ncbi:hypothetical protein CDL15_Pgr024935 [Punica granatum]|uniref:Uncharacterized protein n=1 Tax=Punica granatum TaxID=22663 RepID=A0A218W8E5_PUNGR|nr:hypothetical protein CDL15_Pgr024935 [Punica granatum]
MGVKVAATTCLHWSQPVVPQSPSFSQALASAISSPASPCRRSPTRSAAHDSPPLVFRHLPRLDRSPLFGSATRGLQRSRSSDYPKSRPHVRRTSCSSSFSDEEFFKKIQELTLKFQLEGDESSTREKAAAGEDMESVPDRRVCSGSVADGYNDGVAEETSEAPLWQEEIVPPSIERKASSVDLPLSLRIIQRKMQWQDGFREAGESAYCSMKKAFSSMVFIIRELQSFALQMREILFYEDLQGILVRVQKEMHASFVWLFQQIFSHTPTLMVYVMILLANFTVHSMSSNAAIMASPSSLGPYAAATETASVVEVQDSKVQKFDSSSIRTYSISSSSSGKTTPIGGNNGGGNIRPVASGTDGDGQFRQSDYYQTIMPDGGGASQLSSFGATRDGESISGQAAQEEEVSLWNSMVEEAAKMQSELRDKALDHETMQKFVSPVTAKIEADLYAEYFRTELLYQTSLSLDPNNALLLANYAQFLYAVAHDYDRAEEYFKKAVAVEPPDAEAHNKYASFLWKVRNDLWAAEETFLGAISADPANSFYAANYAHFLWNTGGQDTCFPLNDNAQQT